MQSASKRVIGITREEAVMKGFSWKRAVGITDAKRKIARATGIPTTKSGRKRKAQNLLWKALFGKK